MIYLIGSLRNPQIPILAEDLRKLGHEVFDDWYAPGPETDEYWRQYEVNRGRSYQEALDGIAARNVFDLDFYHLNRAKRAILVMPAGRSGHLELGWAIGQCKPGYVLFDGEPERYDQMYALCRTTGGAIFTHRDQLLEFFSDLSIPRHKTIEVGETPARTIGDPWKKPWPRSS